MCMCLCVRERARTNTERVFAAHERERKSESVCVCEREIELAPTRSELPRRTAVSEVSSCVIMLLRVPAVSPWERDRERELLIARLKGGGVT